MTVLKNREKEKCMKNKVAKKLVVLFIILSFIISIFPTVQVSANDDYIEIRTATDLYNIRNNLSGNYKLMNDIDLSEVTSKGGLFDYKNSGWRPIGGAYSEEDFTGIFDGQGYTITGMRFIANPNKGVDSSIGALFGVNSGKIKNLKLSQFDIRTAPMINCYVGALVGTNTGTIENIYVTDCKFTVNNHDYNQRVGGIAGSNNSIIQYCYNDSLFSYDGYGYYNSNSGHNGTTHICGIATASGYDYVFKYCVNKGCFTKSENSNSYIFSGITNGIYGLNGRVGEVSDCYSIRNGDVQTGFGENTKVKNSYEFNGNNVVVYKNVLSKSVQEIITLNPNQMYSSIFYEGFDFENTWYIDDKLGYKLPLLRNTYNGDTKEQNNAELSIEGWTYGESAQLPVLVGNSGEGKVTYEYKEKDAGDDTYTKSAPYEAGEYTIRATIEETEYYKGAVLTKDFSIAKKKLTVSGILANDKTYDGTTLAEFDCNAATISGLINGDAISVTGVGDFENKNVGNNKRVTIREINLIGSKSKDYVVDMDTSQKNTTADIIAREISVTADGKEKIYGESDPLLTYKVNGLASGDSVGSIATGKLTRMKGENVGKYEITQGTLAFGNNYTVIYISAYLSINKTSGSQTKPNPPQVIGITESTIAVKTTNGYEYSIDGGKSWSTIGVFNNLKEYTQYSIVSRRAETENETEGMMSDATVVRTLKKHVHNYSSSVIEQPTCSEAGLLEYSCECGDKYTKIIQATGHLEVKDNAIEPTCTKTGLTEGSHCERCGQIFIKQEEIPRTDHEYGEWMQSEEDDNVVFRICRKCGNREDSEHKWDAGNITKQATCTEDGEITYTCLECDAIKTAKIIAKGHSPVVDERIEPTCTKEGKSSGIHCSVCNKVIVEQIAIPVIEHSWNKGDIIQEATCTSKGIRTYKCIECGATKNEDIAMRNHDEILDEGIPATCTEAGKTAGSHCSVCGTVITAQQTIKAIGHSWNSGKVTKAATCTAKGVKTYTCTNCKVSKTEDISATGHKEVTDAEVPATCTEAGKTAGSHCSVCGTVITAQQTIKATGHSWDSGKITTKPTTSATGVKTYTCTNCKTTKTETIPKLKQEKKAGVSYTTHIQSIGWQGVVRNGELAGTVGDSKRLEAIKINLEDAPYSGNIEYRTHVQTYGWQGWVKNGAVSGTNGEAKRLEAIQIRLTGEIAKYYDVYYRIQVQSFGWLGWAKNGEYSGSAGHAKRLEAIQIILVEKGKSIDRAALNKQGKITSSTKITDSTPYVAKAPSIHYQTHVQSYGWQDFRKNGEMSGTSGQAKRLEGIKINLSKPPYDGGIRYKTHIQSIGWQDWKYDGEMSGTSGQAKRLEAISIELTGDMAEHYDVYYRVHAQSYGWLAWAKNGQNAGTAGYAKRLEGIQIVLVEKGQPGPGAKYQGIMADRTEAYISK